MAINQFLVVKNRFPYHIAGDQVVTLVTVPDLFCIIGAIVN